MFLAIPVYCAGAHIAQLLHVHIVDVGYLLDFAG